MSSRSVSSLPLPKSTIGLLTRAGYLTVGDLNISAEALAKDLKISLPEAEVILASLPKNIATTGLSLSRPALTQSAASIAKTREQRFSTNTPELDVLLSGGLTSGQTLEISGPPGTPKEAIAINIVASFVGAGREVIFIDSQNMTSPAYLEKTLRSFSNIPSDFSSRIYHSSIPGLLDLMAFILSLQKTLASHPNVALLVLNSISFPLQTQNMTFQERSAHLAKIKRALTTAAVSNNLTIVTTSQLSTKMLNQDGSVGSFDTKARGVLVPQLGLAYLPGRAYRVVLVAKGQTTGMMKLLSSPENPQGVGQSRSARYQLKDSDGKILDSAPDPGDI